MVTSTRSYALTDANVAAIAEATDSTYRAMVWLGALTGCRWSEAAGCGWVTSTCLPAPCELNRVIVKDADGRSGVCSPKSEASRRVVALPAALVEMLAEHFTRSGLTATDRDPDGFTAPEGGLLSQDNWRRRVWIPALKAAGLAKARPRPGFHDLRRAVATALSARVLIQDGADPPWSFRRADNVGDLYASHSCFRSPRRGTTG